MPKKLPKLNDGQIDEIVKKFGDPDPGEPAIPVPPPAPAQAKEFLVTVIPENWFSDGNLAGFFARYGYPCEWPRGEARKIPMWLVQRVRQSGGEIVIQKTW